MAEKEELTVGGFVFGTLADANLAEEELQKITYLESKVDYANLAKTKVLYEKMIETKTFQTPVGWSYLSKLRDHLIRGGVPEGELSSVPMYTVFVHEEEKIRPARVRIARRAPSYRNQYRTSLLLNIFLIVLLIAMFAIAWKSETPNIINYRNAIVNEYSTWEQDLTEREREVRIKERENGIISPPDTHQVEEDDE